MKRLGYSILIGAVCTLLFLAISKFQNDKRKTKGGISDLLKKKSSVREAYYSAELQIAIDNTGDNSKLIEQTKEQILYRLRGSYMDLSFGKIDENVYTLKANKILDTTVFKNAIIASGKIEFSELFSLNEISGPLMLIDSVLHSRDANYLNKQKKIQEAKKTMDTATGKISDLLTPSELEKPPADPGLRKFISFISPYQNADGTIRYAAELGYVKTKDTSHLNQILNDPGMNKHLPENLRIVYGIMDRALYSNDSMLNLFAKKNLDRALFPCPTGNQITDAIPQFSPGGQPIISFAFNPAGARAWYLMTERNVNKPIAIIANDVVLSAPVVEAAIEGGESNITGAFTPEETRWLCKMFLAGELPLNTRITEASFTLHAAKKFRLTLIILIFFVLASAASYGISFLIKPASKP